MLLQRPEFVLRHCRQACICMRMAQCRATRQDIALRKWRETKKQPSRARSGNQLSCCLVSLLFLCHILSGRPVHVNAALMQPCCPPKEIPCIRTVNIGRKVIAYMISTSLRQNCFLLSANIMRTRQHFLVRNSGLVFDIQCIT